MNSIDGITPRKIDNPVPVRFTKREKAALKLAASQESESRHELVHQSTIIREALKQYKPFASALRAVKEVHDTSKDN